jgi:hypothetical protein
MVMTDKEFELAIERIFVLYGHGKDQKAESLYMSLVPELERRGYLQDPSEPNGRGLNRR